MSVTAAVVVTAVVVAAVIWFASRLGSEVDTLDPAVEERWLVAWVGRHPRWGRRLRSVDRQVAGGLMVLVALTIAFGSALVVGLLADMVADETGFARWDRSVAEWGSEQATDRSTDVLEVITALGGTGVVIAVAVAVAVWDHRRHRNPQVAVFLATVLAGIAAVNNLLKVIVGRDRPDVEHLVGSAGSAFPSGHAATAAAAWFAFALVATRFRSRRSRIGAATIAALITASVAASRALLGVHWLTDVLAGVAVGWGWFLLCALAFGGRIQRLGEPAERVVSSAGSEASASTRAST